MREAREICERSPSNHQDQRKSTSDRRTELTAGIEQQPGLETFEPTRWLHCLFFAQAHRQFLIKVWRRLRRLPGIEQREGRFQRLELQLAVSTRLNMALPSRV